MTDSPSEGRTRFTELYEGVAAALYAWANARVRPTLRVQLDPEDLLQEICWRAYDRFPTFDAERGTFRGWIFGIANNVLRESLQSLRRLPQRASFGHGSSRPSLGNVPDDATSISRRVARDESLREFVSALDALSDEDRRLLVYRGLEGLSHQDVGEMLGLTLDAAEKRWQRLLKKLSGLAGPHTDLFSE